MISRLLPVVAIALLGLAAPVVAQAASCTLSLPGIDFGVYNPLNGAPSRLAAEVVVDCSTASASETVNYTLSLSTGRANNYAGRYLESEANPLSYNLYTNPGYSQVWGDGTGNSSVVTGSLNLPQQHRASHPIYGSIPAMQSLPAGAYTDTLMLTFDY